MHSAVIKNQTHDASLWLKNGGTVIMDLKDEIPETMVSLVDEWGEKINDDHDIHIDKYCTCQEFDDTVESISSALRKVATFTESATTHAVKENNTTLEEFLETQASDDECYTFL